MTLLLVLAVVGIAGGVLWAVIAPDAPYRIARDDTELRDLWEEWRR